MMAIDADALLKKVERILPWAPYPSKYAQGVRWCMELVGIHIKDAPTIEPERKKGKWIPQDHNKSNGFATTLVYYYPKCSEQNIILNDGKPRWCPLRSKDDS